MPKPLEDCVPRWAVARVCKKKCSCGHKYGKRDIVGIGVRKIHRDGKWARQAMAVESWCPECQKGAVTTFAMDRDELGLRELLCAMLEEVQKGDELDIARRIEQSDSPDAGPIGDQEFDNFMKYLDEMSDYRDFMRDLGISEESEESEGQ